MNWLVRVCDGTFHPMFYIAGTIGGFPQHSPVREDAVAQRRYSSLTDIELAPRVEGVVDEGRAL